MSDGVPRLRMFAGPNGSGKTTVKVNLNKPPEWFGIYINPDDLQAEITATGNLLLTPFGFTATTDEIRAHFAASDLLKTLRMDDAAQQIAIKGDLIDFSGVDFNAYHASALSDYLRRKALDASRSFTFETVMSSPDKVDLLCEAQKRGFRTYLYYIATEDPWINVGRVRNRVANGGHDVPEQKIVSRHERSLKLLPSAIRCTNRAFLFDTSKDDAWYFAEAVDGKTIKLKSDQMPNWFSPTWDQF